MLVNAEMSLTVFLASMSMLFFTASILRSLIDVAGLPKRGSFSRGSLPSLNRLTHLKIVEYNGASVPYTLNKSLRISVGMYPNSALSLHYAPCSVNLNRFCRPLIRPVSQTATKSRTITRN